MPRWRAFGSTLGSVRANMHQEVGLVGVEADQYLAPVISESLPRARRGR